MRPRGQLTLLAALAMIGAGAALVLGPWSELRIAVPGGEVATQTPQGPARLPAVAEGPPAVAAFESPRTRHALEIPSASLFERLPVARQDYEETLSVAEGIDPATPPRWIERVSLAHPDAVGAAGSDLVQVEYTFDAKLTERVFSVLDRGRVKQGHVIVMDARSGRILAYVTTDREHFPPDRSYPAASLVKVVTAAAALDRAPEAAREPCVFRGNQYRLTRSRLNRPRRGGQSTSLERALATSNNQCFARLAVNTVGSQALLSALQRFGWLEEPAPGHPPGSVDAGHDEYDLGRLGCGLSGCRITPLHAVQLAATLADGRRLEPWWIDRVVDSTGRELTLPRRTPPRQVMTPELAAELRRMLVRTTTRGTARSAFRDRRGRPKLAAVEVAGKTGNLSGREPSGRYEWFIGLAPAPAPTIAVAVLQLQGNLWWSKSSEIAANVLVEVFCEGRRCAPQLAARYTQDLSEEIAPILLSGEGSRLETSARP